MEMRTTMKTKTRPRKLPYDPDGMNDQRAAWAGLAIRTFRWTTGSDLEEALADLLADLMHWSDRSGIPFEASLELARFHYDAETEEE